MTDYERLRELAEKAEPGPWSQSTGRPWRVNAGTDGDGCLADVHGNREDATAEYIAAVHPDVILNLLEDLRITRAERDAEKKKNMKLRKDTK